MAGGSGTRFWPLSRQKKPKQFLPIISNKTMIEETVERLLPLVPYPKIYTVANPELTESLRKHLPQLPEENFIVEPCGKNTAPSLILATASIFLQNHEAVVAALPADHLIKNASLFRKKLKAAFKAAVQSTKLITFGIPPSFPATGYGYIHFSQVKPLLILREKFYKVEQFKEKPKLDQARIFLRKGNYFWNSGIFIWQASVFAQKIKNYAPELFKHWPKLVKALKNKDRDQISSIFSALPSISIDYALMERAKGVLMAEGNFGWSDVGAWSSLADIWPKEEKKNALRGDSILLESEGCLLHSPHKLTALIGVKDLIVVDTEDALLICHKDHDQKVKEVVEKLKKEGKIELL